MASGMTPNKRKALLELRLQAQIQGVLERTDNRLKNLSRGLDRFPKRVTVTFTF